MLMAGVRDGQPPLLQLALLHGSIVGCGLWMQCGSQALPQLARRCWSALELNCHPLALPICHCHYTPLVYESGSIHRNM